MGQTLAQKTEVEWVKMISLNKEKQYLFCTNKYVYN